VLSWGRMAYTESGTVEKPIVEWLQELGWTYVEPESIVRDYDEAFDQDRLVESLKKLNPTICKSSSDIERIVSRITQLDNDIRGNKEFFDWLKNEGSISLRPGEKSRTIKLIDYDNPKNNIFTVTNQYKFHGYENIRPDIVLFINGIPLILIECKSQTHESVDYTNAITQILRYNEQAPQLFKHLAFCIATDGANFRYGWTNEGRYFMWRNGFDDPLEAAVKNFLTKENVLDFLQNFIVFETAHEEVTKKIAMQQQCEATNKIVERVIKDEADRGLVWHTQGSGKTLTMLYTAWKLKRQPELENPTIILVVDRLELQRQFRETFGNVDFPYVTWAKNTKELMEKIGQQSREVIITTIQKFHNPKYQDPRENVIIMIDEAHRSQYGQLAVRMRKTFPNAKIFGFTGTPIDLGPTGRSTFRTFCDSTEKYLHKYSIKQSIEDGATVPIVYEPRLTREHIPKEILDKEFLKISEGLSQEEQEEILGKSARLKTILKAEHRIEKIAKDIASHYLSHVEPNRFKAQLVAVDREACALYKEELNKHLPKEYSTVIYSSSPNDPKLLRKYHMSREDQLKISRREFQKKDTLPKILVVTDMLLTGFDAPVERVMYLDKPLRDHKLLQAIARTNRPYPGKDSALIVDYVGIFHRLEDALNFDAGDIEGIAEVLDVLKEEFKTVLAELNKIFKEIPKENTRESLIAAIKLLTEEVVRIKFKEKLSRAKALYETIAPDPYLSPYLYDYTWFTKINEAYNKHIRDQKPSLKPYEEKTKRLIRESIILKDIDKSLPTFEIGPEYLDKIEQANLDPKYEVAEIRQALSYYFRIHLVLNPVLESLSEKLERIIKRKDPEKIRNELRQLVQEINTLEAERSEKGLRREEFAVFNIVKDELEEKVPEEEVIGFTKRLLGNLYSSSLLFKGWDTKSETRKDVRRFIFDKCFDQYKEAVKGRDLLDLSDNLTDFLVRFGLSE